MTKFELFCEKFGSKLSDSARWDSFRLIADILFSKNAPIWIGETGTVRVEDNWIGEGNSTRLWDFIVRETSGAGFTCDISDQAIITARRTCPNMTALKHNSLEVLMSLKVGIERLDLLYLDSMDFVPPYENSMLHHLAEFSIAWPRLKSGALLAVDDCVSRTEGKGAFISPILARMGIFPLVEDIVTVWKKP